MFHFYFSCLYFFPLKKGDIKLVSGGAKNEDKCISFHILHLSDPVQSTYYLEWTRAVSRHCFFLIVSSVQLKKNSCYFCTWITFISSAPFSLLRKITVPKRKANSMRYIYCDCLCCSFSETFTFLALYYYIIIICYRIRLLYIIRE